MSEFLGKQNEKIIEFLLVFVISGCLRGSILETRGDIKNQKFVCSVGYFSGVGSGRILGGFVNVFWMFAYNLLVVALKFVESLWERGCWNCWVDVGKI